jgi:hypothetical protein
VSLSSPDVATKNTSGDPGARFGAFACSYRLPFAGNRLTFYADSEAHDDVSPLTLRGARRIDRDRTFPICQAFLSWTCAPRQSPLIPLPRAVSVATSTTLKTFRGREIPTKANSSAIGSGARVRAAKAELPIT